MEHDPALVGLAIAVGALAAYTTLLSLDFIDDLGDRSGFWWMMAAGFTLGLGAWTLHFVAMLAMKLPVDLSLGAFRTLISLMIGCGATMLAFGLLWRRPARFDVRPVMALVFGAGITAMHYTGMAAMGGGIVQAHTLPAMAGSLAWGTTVAYIGFLVAFPPNARRGKHGCKPQRLPLASMCFGIAVAGLHFIGMAGFDPHSLPEQHAALAIDAQTLVILVSAGMIVILFILLWLALLTQWRKSKRLLAERDRTLRRIMLHLPAMAFRSGYGADDYLTYISEGAEAITGYPAEAFQQRDVSYDELIIAESRVNVLSARRNAGPEGYVIDYQLIRRDGHRRWIRERGSRTTIEGEGPVLEGFVEDVTKRKTLENQLQYQASYDHLTGVMNRFRIEARLEEEMERTSHLGIPLSILMLDVDHFKALNDNFGHDMGDRVLEGVGELLRKRLRSLDCLGRWGGEEFVVILPGSDLESAQAVAESLRAIIESTPFASGSPLTVSIGVASHNAGERRRDFVIRADDALYAAKESGRNTVVAA
ncbi:diguanylate cyclase [Aquisalimonas sp.]|uniref:sensor domain-containing diguanylate cyclase n=1 Tax=unclassified Aquisalimonas TaxID=2644645 RepID=UPI0025BD3A43|nr:diguanylate cyclase [Aquisalimonas sp.]